MIAFLFAMFNPILSPYLCPSGGIPVKERIRFPIYNPSGVVGVASHLFSVSVGVPETWDPRDAQEGFGGVSYYRAIKRNIYVGFYSFYQGSRYGKNWALLLGGFTAYSHRNWVFGVSYNLYSKNNYPLSLLLPVGPWLNASIKYHPREIAYGNFWAGIGMLNSYLSPLLYWGGITLNFSDVKRFYPDMVWAFAYRDDTLQISISTRLYFFKKRLELGSGILFINKDVFNPIGGINVGGNLVISDLIRIEIGYGIQIPYDTDNIKKWRHTMGLTVIPIRIPDKKGLVTGKSQTESQVIKRLKSRIEVLERERAKLQQQYWTLQEIVKALEEHKISVVETVYVEETRSQEDVTLETITAIPNIQILVESDTLIHIRLSESVLAFMPGSADLPVDGLLILKKIAMFLRQNPEYDVEISGHTDSVPLGPKGREKYGNNVGLSLARAKAVKDYFVRVEGLPQERFTVKGFGAKRPIAPNKTIKGRARNRRVEIIIKKIEKP